MRIKTETATLSKEADKRYNTSVRKVFAALSASVIALSASSAFSAPIYFLRTFIAVPPSAANLASSNTVPGSFNSYDIMWFDGTTQNLYLADRSNASVDIFSAATNSFVGRIGGNATAPEFQGFKGSTAISGPNGLVIGDTGGAGGSHNLYAGDGTSTLQGYNLASFGTIVGNPTPPPIPNNSPARLPNPNVTPAQPNPGFTPIATGTPADNRVDEMAFGRLDANTSRLLVANNAAAVPFVTLINTSNNANTILAKLSANGAPGQLPAAGGIEQSVFDPSSKVFYLNVQTPGAGSVVKIDPLTFSVTTYDLHGIDSTVTACTPTGLALVSPGVLAVGCDLGTAALNKAQNIKTLLLDTNTLKITKIGVSGEDMVWFDTARNLLFTASRNNPDTGPVLGVIDSVGDLLQLLPTSLGAHSVAVDPVSGEIFVPFGGTGSGGISPLSACPDSLATLGCIAVFALVPEPGSLALLTAALVVLGASAWRRRRQA